MTAGTAPLQRYVEARLAERDRIAAGRRRALDELAAQLAARLAGGHALDVVFVCTHNSRRSQMGQVWGQTAARRFGLEGVRTWSGGTETTCFEPRAVAALQRAGFSVDVEEAGSNPVHRVDAGDGGGPMRCWSKQLADPAHPPDGFVAVMTCSAADQACPTVPGAALRVPLTYEDPKAFDGTDRETRAYDDRCAEIARDMLYLWGEVAARR